MPRLRKAAVRWGQRRIWITVQRRTVVLWTSGPYVDGVGPPMRDLLCERRKKPPLSLAWCGNTSSAQRDQPPRQHVQSLSLRWQAGTIWSLRKGFSSLTWMFQRVFIAVLDCQSSFSSLSILLQSGSPSGSSSLRPRWWQRQGRAHPGKQTSSAKTLQGHGQGSTPWSRPDQYNLVGSGWRTYTSINQGKRQKGLCLLRVWFRFYVLNSLCLNEKLTVLVLDRL